METLILRLVANPHDEEALAYAHRAGTQDPRAYAVLLEKVGAATTDPTYAAHWLSEAANVWSTTIGDAHHAARTLMGAIEKDPTARTAADRLAQLYRDKGDQKALVALLERLVKSLTPLLAERPEVRAQVASMHEELGRLWSEPPFGRPERALENWRRLAELDPRHQYAIYSARELLKQQQQWADAVPYFAMEQALVGDPDRKVALYRDEAEVRRRFGDLSGATQALRTARTFRPDDSALKQEVGVAILERISAGELVPHPERDEAAQLFVSLAETYDGEYGFSYAVSALKAAPGHDRAMQLADYYGAKLGRMAELGPRYAAYLQANPGGFMANEARAKAGSSLPPQALPSMPGGLAHGPGAARPSYAAPAAQGPAGGYPRQPGASQPPARPGSSAPPGSNGAPVPHAAEPGAIPFIGALPTFQQGGGSVPPGAPASPELTAGAPAQEAAPAASLEQLLEEAQAESQKNHKPQALAKFRDALKLDPANPEALSWVEDHLRQKRMYADLRDVLLAASRVSSVSAETRKGQLREVAGMCESQLRDVDGAIQAWKQIVQIDRADEQARDQLRRLLERGARWDDLATVLEQEAMGASDVEEKISLEKKLAALHETKRKDPAAAAEAWARIATLAPDDESAIQTAVKLYEKGERFDLAAAVIADSISGISEPTIRGALQQKLGELRLKTNDSGGAGEAFAEAAEALGQAKVWELAEKAFIAANRFADAANALDQRAQLASGKPQAALFAQAADLLLKAGDAGSAITKLEQATEIDPANDAYAQALDEQYRRDGREPDLVRFLLSRAEKLNDKPRRVTARRTAAEIQSILGDREGARESLLLLLSDGDDSDALAKLIEDAGERGDYQDQVELLRRLGSATKNPAERIDIALREASVLAESLGDTEGAIERYEAIFKDLDPQSRIALHAIADLEEQRGNHPGSAAALEREIPLAQGPERVELAQRLAQIYEEKLADPRGAIKALEIVHAADPEDFEAIARLQRLSEEVEDWPRVAGLMQALIDIEGDEEEASRLSVRLAEILEVRLEKGDEALAVLERMADQGDEACRVAYVALGDKLGWKGIVATKLVAWNESSSGPQRNEALRSAFHRFLDIGREADAARVAMELARSRGADRDLAVRLEEIAIKLKDLDALGVAHDILGKETSGLARATELVRQAEVQVQAAVDPLEAMQHGESGLTSVPPGEVEPLLARLAVLTQAPGHVIDLYERQVGRCRAPADRLVALARAAQIAAERGANDRARSFFELALGGGVQEETISSLESAARLGDDKAGGTALRAILAEALAAGGQGSRDGGRTRGALLRRAATIAYRDLHDVDKAFGWLGDALITHVDDASLEALEHLGGEVSDLHRVEATLSRALEEVFDGPLVRKLLQRRAKLRRDVLEDRKGAAVDLKKLHDLSPSDQDVMNDLSNLLLELGDHRGMIQLYEDQILRGRDPALRAELARKVARIWEEDLGDAREAADAWRRVLRMKAGDAEATAGLDRAKTNKLKHTPPPPSGASESTPSTPADAPSAAPGPSDASSTTGSSASSPDPEAAAAPALEATSAPAIDAVAAPAGDVAAPAIEAAATPAGDAVAPAPPAPPPTPPAAASSPPAAASSPPALPVASSSPPATGSTAATAPPLSAEEDADRTADGPPDSFAAADVAPSSSPPPSESPTEVSLSLPSNFTPGPAPVPVVDEEDEPHVDMLLDAPAEAESEDSTLDYADASKSGYYPQAATYESKPPKLPSYGAPGVAPAPQANHVAEAHAGHGKAPAGHGAKPLAADDDDDEIAEVDDLELIEDDPEPSKH